MYGSDTTLEMAKLVRECEEAIRAKLAARQLGELFRDLPGATGKTDDKPGQR